MESLWDFGVGVAAILDGGNPLPSNVVVARWPGLFAGIWIQVRGEDLRFRTPGKKGLDTDVPVPGGTEHFLPLAL